MKSPKTRLCKAQARSMKYGWCLRVEGSDCTDKGEKSRRKKKERKFVRVGVCVIEL